jgi:hypothetical protein
MMMTANQIQTVKHLLQNQEFQLEAQPITTSQKRIVELWNTIFHDKPSHQINIGGESDQNSLLLRGQDNQVLIDWQEQANFTQPSADRLTLDIRQLIEGAFLGDGVSNLTGFKLKLKDDIIIMESEYFAAVIHSLNRFGRRSAPWLAEILIVASTLMVLGIDRKLITEGIHRFSAFNDRIIKKDKHVGLTFLELSDISTFYEANEILRLAPNGSWIILGGRFEEIPESFLHIAEDKNLEIVALENIGNINADPEALRAKSFEEATHLVYEHAEAPTEIWFMSGVGLNIETSEAMKKCFLREVIDS